jgi:hypothetical protein
MVRLLTSAPAQTSKADPPKGLAASRFANPTASDNGNDNDDNTANQSAEGEAEPDHSSAALASVRTTLAYHAAFL